ncbi:MAG: hypothetical protein CVU48_03625 [Candidatus Cloacimonetes bacterium HGW-Cloacimonetes-1]|nr:MAG: hypothetical protein CVU48_03625 [Candidatus Cloacimonetes bacterium HGW-Cloacimonetes-1]
MEDRKKQVAALSGVIAYLSNEPTETYVPTVAPTLPTPWSAYGRTQTMQYRDITQRRIIKRTR